MFNRFFKQKSKKNSEEPLTPLEKSEKMRKMARLELDKALEELSIRRARKSNGPIQY
jgi:hypothetical protein